MLFSTVPRVAAEEGPGEQVGERRAEDVPPARVLLLAQRVLKRQPGLWRFGVLKPFLASQPVFIHNI